MTLGRIRRLRPVLLGLDVGSSFVKAVVFDDRGRALATAIRGVPLRRPVPGWVERDADQTWRAVADAVRRVAVGRAVAAIGVTGCGNGAVFVDGRVRPLRAGILSSDRRATAFVRRASWARQTAYAGQSLPLLRWFRAAEPSAASKLAHVLGWKDFVRARLTGEIATDPTDAGASGWLDPATRLRRSLDPALPPVRESLGSAGAVTARAARLTGLRTGTPVFMGCIDCEASAIGSGVAQAGELSLVAGTWSINQMFVDHLPRRRDFFLVNPSVLPGRWLVLEGSPTSAANLDWAVRAFGGGDTVGAMRLVEPTPRSRALFVPRVPTGEGAFMGIGATHGPSELLRTVVEGVAFGHRVHVEKLVGRQRGSRRVRLAGGLARSPFGAQLFADVLGCTIEVPAGDEIGALGAALCAGVGVGVWSTLHQAQIAAVHVERVYTPRLAVHTELTRDFVRFVRAWSFSAL